MDVAGSPGDRGGQAEHRVEGDVVGVVGVRSVFPEEGEATARRLVWPSPQANTKATTPLTRAVLTAEPATRLWSVGQRGHCTSDQDRLCPWGG
jgi:hypothetical protein